MTFNEYQKISIETAIFPSEKGLEYLALGLTNEAGEVAGKVKKLIRDKNGVLTDEDRDKISKECGDVLWYLSTFLNHIEMDFDSVAVANIEKLQDRKNRGRLSGDGDER